MYTGDVFSERIEEAEEEKEVVVEPEGEKN